MSATVLFCDISMDEWKLEWRSQWVIKVIDVHLLGTMNIRTNLLFGWGNISLKPQKVDFRGERAINKSHLERSCRDYNCLYKMLLKQNFKQQNCLAHTLMLSISASQVEKCRPLGIQKQNSTYLMLIMLSC